MRILQLTWEYPPRVVGGISRVVQSISQRLSKEDTVYVVTFSEDYERFEDYGNLKVARVPLYPLNPLNFIDWVMLMNMAMAEKAIYLAKRFGNFDIVHAHDWLTAFAARIVKHSLRVPMVCTIHATEHGRNSGIHNDLQRFIHNVEWWTTFEGWKVIVNSNYMKNECERIFNLTPDKCTVIPNGIDFEEFAGVEYDIEFRRRFALDSEKIIFFIGRHVYEKGVHILLESFRMVLEKYYNAKLVIAGSGPMYAELYSRALGMGISHKVLFTGFISDEERKKLFKVADIAVFPSLYEPFGIVALEAMASGCATIVSDVGGFAEIVKHGENGLTFFCGNANSLKDMILLLLNDEDLRRRIAAKGFEDAKEIFSWDKIVQRLRLLYKDIIDRSKSIEWFCEKSNF
ncbi:glycosyltransferase family 4 protein [Caldicellulosiruptor morganii]|uniref:Glycosyltransferase family 4 protein n=1 Tax=Caldicellulosiruptor morganii TaxID=1387555 RepID=A0ABY7BPW8_9FIRM|nr:glycosyltransferase family 4 protein [Caldicellulosiruptor morganii]WAM33947.1 glycosyltransferase family 4 protein [Caldicellulosiruptor morganii]